MSRKLHEIVTDLSVLLAQVEENDGELTPEIAEELEDTGLELRDKVDAVMAYREDVLGDAEKFKAGAARLTANRQTLERTAKSLADYVRGCLEAADVKSIATERFKKIWRQNNPVKVVVDDAERVPEEYRLATLTVALAELPGYLLSKATISPDTAAIKTDLQAGLEVDGARLEQGEHLRAK